MTSVARNAVLKGVASEDVLRVLLEDDSEHWQSIDFLRNCFLYEGVRTENTLFVQKFWLAMTTKISLPDADDLEIDETHLGVCYDQDLPQDLMRKAEKAKTRNV
jgi:hypothetical protein